MALGVRGEAAPQEGATSNFAALESAAGEAAARLRELANAPTSGSAPATQTVQAAAGGGLIRHLDGGGHLSGPGTTTSDSIPAMLSDQEYVIKASSARKLGRDNLDWLNAGAFADGGDVARRLARVRRFAAGGAVGGEDEEDAGSGRSPTPRRRSGAPAPVASGEGAGYSVSYDPETGGLNIDGNSYPPGSALLNEPVWQQIWQKARADYARQSKESGATKRKQKSDFVGRFGHSDGSDTHLAEGGPIGHFAEGGAVGNLQNYFSRHFAGGGSVSLAPMLNLAGGGGVEGLSYSSAPDLSGISGPTNETLHPVTLDFGDRQVGGLRAAPSALGDLRRSARDRAMSQTGPAPSWVR